MTHPHPFGLVPLLLLAACSSSTASDTTDAAPDTSSDTSTPDAPRDATTDTGTTDVTRPADVPAPQGYCDGAQIAIVRTPGAAPAVLAVGRVLSTSDGTMPATAESVEIQLDGRTVQRLEGSWRFTPGANDSIVARGTADAMLAARCDRDDARFTGIGFIVQGTVDGRPFTARCGAAERSTRWPPSGYLTCHDGVDAPPHAGSAIATTTGTFTDTTLTVFVGHGAGAAVTTVDPSVRLIPQRSPFSTGAPLVPRTVDGWMTSVSETTAGGTSQSQLSLLQTGDPLGELCVAPPMPGAMPMPGPAFLGRITGQTARGAFRTEALFVNCDRLHM